MLYFYLKWIHIISATLLFGTGLGSAYYMHMAHRSRSIPAIQFAVRAVVIADFCFTTPTVIIQPLTGFYLIHLLHYPWDVFWLKITYILYVITGTCWIPVVFIQMKIHHLIRNIAPAEGKLPQAYFKYMRYWYALGYPAFTAVLGIFYLMVFKPMG